jgi:lipopolysaccharide/colanic/teichoic acid biosynthesis glycosyltransferase
MAKPVRQRVAFHPWLAPAADALGRRLLPRLARCTPGTPLAKAAGMVRMHVEGNRPVADQRWPACLEAPRNGVRSAATRHAPPATEPVSSAGGDGTRARVQPSDAAPSPRNGRRYPAAKRAADVALAAAGLAATLPLLATIAAAVKLSSEGPVLFQQTRVGRGGRPFTMFKFRTMRCGAVGPEITSGGDPRVTAVGRVLRASKLDELPQLWNVLAGDMSLVGPRPEVRRYVDLFPDAYERILAIRPGITDFAAVAFRDEERLLAAFPDPERAYVDAVLPAKIRLYERYLEEMSPWTDFSLVARTLTAMMR